VGLAGRADAALRLCDGVGREQGVVVVVVVVVVRAS